MSGGTFLNFKVDNQPTESSSGAVVIAGIPIQTGAPVDSQYLGYNSADNQWAYRTLPNAAVLSASGTTAVATASTDITFPTAGVTIGVEITAPTTATFELAPGTYKLHFQFQNVTWTSPAAADVFTYQFYNQTATAGFGGTGQVVSPNNATVTTGTTLETIVNFLVQTTISVRFIAVTAATAPTINGQSINICKLN